MKDFLIRHLFYAGVEKEEFDSIKADIIVSNWKVLIPLAIVSFVLVSILFLLSFVINPIFFLRNLYVSGMLFSATLLLFVLIAKENKSFSYLGVYLSISFFLIYGILISVINPNEKTVTFMVMLLLVSLIYLDYPIRIGLIILFYIITFIIVTSFVKKAPIKQLDITSAIVFGFLSITCGFLIAKMKVKNFVMSKQLKLMSETDFLTGLYNRNCYESRLMEYSKMTNPICCIYIDVNGLHQLNNTKSHIDGDKMLIFIAHSLKTTFRKADIFRIGGDEFLVFSMNQDENLIKVSISLFLELISQAGYTVALGWEFGKEGSKLSDIIRAAEKKMYKDKEDYYKTHTR